MEDEGRIGGGEVNGGRGRVMEREGRRERQMEGRKEGEKKGRRGRE